MEIITSIDEVSIYCSEHKKKNPESKIGFIPTMGSIHKGHLALIQEAKKKTDHVVVSIFVNPTQFNQKSDFDKYPRNIERDQKILQEEKIHLLFLPNIQEVYPEPEIKTRISIPSLQKNLCAPSRPGHFEGVLLIIYYLFHWIRPYKAFFGLKDYQQFLCVKTMTTELKLDVEIIGIPTIRERNGLALSSRNKLLSIEAKKNATVIYETFKMCEKKWREGASSRELGRLLNQGLKVCKVDYAGVYDPDTLESLNDNYKPPKALLAVAGFFEGVRLIDNHMLQ